MTDARINELLALSERTSVGGEQVDAWCEMASSDDPMDDEEAVCGMSEGVLALADEYTVLLATKAGLAEALEEIRRLSKILVEITLAAVDQVGRDQAAAGVAGEHNDIEYMFKAFTKLNCHRNALKTLLLDLLADVESCGGPCGRPELLARIDAAIKGAE